MALDRQPVVLPDLDVDADDPAPPEQLEDRRVQDERPAVGDAALDDDLGPDPPDQLLDDDDVLGQLDDRDARAR